MNKVKIGMVSLGCDKNRVDAEKMLSSLVAGGFEIESDPKKADVIIINTCGFIEPARKESIDTFFEMNSYKKGGLKKIIVTGCLAELHGKTLFKELTEADCVCGVGSDIVDAVNKTINSGRVFMPGKKTACFEPEARTLTTAHYAYLKIAEGCDNFCSYCLIPKIRGRFRSAAMESLLSEAQGLADGGVTELILVAQDVTKYGLDIYAQKSLVPLLTRLSGVGGIKRIRLLYCYPELIDDALLDCIAGNEKICKYIDIPLQHVDSGILKLMNRKSDYESVCALFDKLKSKYPEIAVRSTFITGFPTETRAQHEAVKDFLIKYKPYNVGFFAYSREEGTPAAKMGGQVSEDEKQLRVEELYRTQSKIAFEANEGYIGKTLCCLVDEASGGGYIGRANFQAPDIDGVVKIASKAPLKTGEYVDVRITSYDEYDLKGEVK